MADDDKLKLDDGPKLVKVMPGELELGGKIMCTLYNGDREVIRTYGESVNNQHDIDVLFSKGLYKVEGEFVHKRNDTTERSGPNSKFRRGAGGRRTEAAIKKKAPRITEVPLEKTKVHIGIPLQLQPRWPNAPTYTVRLIGYHKDLGVMVTPPSTHGEYVMIHEWDGFTVRFFTGQAAYLFDTMAMKQTLVPYPVLHLTYPKYVRFQKIRDRVRMPIELIAVAQDEKRGLTASVIIGDLSTGGASLSSRTPLGNIGDGLRLKFKLAVEDIEVLLELACCIRKVGHSVEGKTDGTYGVSFERVSPEDSITLLAFVNNAVLEL